MKDGETFLTHDEDARIPEGLQLRPLKSGRVSYKEWFLPVNFGSLTLDEAYHYLSIVGAPQGQIPEIIRWTEGKDSHLVKQFFYGGVDLRAHDYIHILLGRGLLPKDEAFVIGFTMGSTNRLGSMNEDAFAYIAKYHYPNAYRMDDESRRVFLDASKLAYVSDCLPLYQVDFEPFREQTIDATRAAIKLRTDLLTAYYRDVEQARFPNEPTSLRLLQTNAHVEEAWSLDAETDYRAFGEVAAEKNLDLDKSDQAFLLDESQFSELLESDYRDALIQLGEQRDLAKLCFEEIVKVHHFESEQANRDVSEKRLEDFYEKAREDLVQARLLIRREVAHASWEGYRDESEELRTWVHALLGRGCSQIDRAFSRGFFHGTSKERSSYASRLKVRLMSQIPLSRDGLYSAEMAQSYHDGVRLGHLIPCKEFSESCLLELRTLSLKEARKQLGLKTGLLKAYRNLEEDR